MHRDIQAVPQTISERIIRLMSTNCFGQISIGFTGSGIDGT